MQPDPLDIYILLCDIACPHCINCAVIDLDTLCIVSVSLSLCLVSRLQSNSDSASLFIINFVCSSFSEVFGLYIWGLPSGANLLGWADYFGDQQWLVNWEF